jgi:hypothetical protein
VLRLLDHWIDAGRLASWFGSLFLPPRMANREGEELVLRRTVCEMRDDPGEVIASLDATFERQVDSQVWHETFAIDAIDLAASALARPSTTPPAARTCSRFSGKCASTPDRRARQVRRTDQGTARYRAQLARSAALPASTLSLGSYRGVSVVSVTVETDGRPAPCGATMGVVRGRLQALGRMWARAPKRLRETIVLLVGTTIVLLGLALIVLPGPFTLPLLLLGFAILGTEFAWAASALDKTKAGMAAGTRAARRAVSVAAERGGRIVRRR